MLPVVPDFTHLDLPPNTMTAEPFDDGWTNVMFVGRVIPNKKFEDVIRAFHVYRTRHNPRSRLLLVGSYGGFEKYLAMLHALVARLGTPDVHFLGHVSNEELTALYDVADLFLCASEHEGFCVPLIESFYKQVPVLAYAATAVPATMDGGGVLYDTKDPFEVARADGRASSTTRTSRTRSIATQDAALDRLLAQGLRRHAAALRRPGPRHARRGRRRRCPTTSGRMFDQAERLEELRQFRPAIYRALPRSRGRGPTAGTPRPPSSLRRSSLEPRLEPR